MNWGRCRQRRRPFFSGRYELILMATCNERFCIGLFWMYEQDRIGEIGKRADAPRRWSAWRWFSAFLQPHFGGSCACHRCHGVGEPTRANILNCSSAVFVMRRTLAHANGECFYQRGGNPMTKATAEGRLYNHSPRLASLPGVRVRKKNLPPKSGCINHGK